MAIAVTLEDLARKTDNENALILAEASNTANSKYLNNDKSPSRKVSEIDNRGSHFYLAMYWAEAIATQDKNPELKAKFAKLAKVLTANESTILEELNAAQGNSVEIGGYYISDPEKTSKAMRPSETLNGAIAAI